MNTVTFLPLVYGEYWAPSIIFGIVSILTLKRPGMLLRVPKVSLLLIGLLFVGTISYFMSAEIAATNVFRDSLIILNIIFLYISGYWIGRTNWESFVKALKLASVFYSAFYLIKFGYLLSNIGLNISDSQSYRIQMGSGEFIIVIGLYFYISDFRRHSIFFPLLLVTVALLTQSRTILIYLTILLFMAVNLRMYKKGRTLFILLMITQMILVSITFLSYTSTFSVPIGGDNLIGKLQGSLAEMRPAFHPKTEVGSFWRGFETYLALEVFKASNIYQFLLGHGAGFAIPLPYEMTLSGNEFNELPFLHNGYAAVLVKSGVVGLLLYAIFLFLQLRVALGADLNVLYTATVLFTIFATLVMAGPFEKNDFTHVTLLLGALSGRSIAVKVFGKRTARFAATGTLQMQRANTFD